MINIHHRVLIKTPAKKVYEALTTQEGLAGWWTSDTIAKPETNSISRFGFGPDYFKEIKITELVPNKVVDWTVLKAQEEWPGTTIRFELEPHKDGTVVMLKHEGWKAYTNEFAGCNFHWAMFLRSLRLLCETGKGQPYPHQLQ